MGVSCAGILLGTPSPLPHLRGLRLLPCFAWAELVLWVWELLALEI